MSYPGLTKRTGYGLTPEDANTLQYRVAYFRATRGPHRPTCPRLQGMPMDCDQMRHRKANYGLTHVEYLALVHEQGHRCAICGQPKKLVVDHDHDTGKVRGLLCARCNLALGFVEDGFANKAEQYLAAKGRKKK